MACVLPEVAAQDESVAVRKVIEAKNALAEEYYRTGDIDRLDLLWNRTSC